jgi:hypothetical protein
MPIKSLTKLEVKYCSLMLFMLPFISCTLTERNISGRYHDYLNFENATYLQLNSDNSYEFKQQVGLVIFKGNGNWSLVNDSLRLTNMDSSLSNGTPIPQQVFLIKGTKLVEVSEDRLHGLKLKRS